MKSSKHFLTFWFIVLFSILMPSLSTRGQIPNRSDTYRVKITAKRTFDGRVNFEVPVEYYISPGKVLYERRGSFHVLRFDKQKHWTIASNKKSYTEQNLVTADTVKKVTPITKAGLKYVPDYYWEIKDAQKDSVISGLRCHLYIASGDADYSERIVYLWLTRDLPSELEILNDRVFRDYLVGTEVGDKLFEHVAELKKGVAIYTLDIETLSISSGQVSLEHKIELQDLPKETIVSFELPEGSKKLN